MTIEKKMEADTLVEMWRKKREEDPTPIMSDAAMLSTLRMAVACGDTDLAVYVLTEMGEEPRPDIMTVLCELLELLG